MYRAATKKHDEKRRGIPRYSKCSGCELPFSEMRTNHRCDLCTADHNARRRAGSDSRVDYRLILNRTNGRCAMCLCLPEEIEFDHIIPICLGGEHVADNVQLLCRECHVSKGRKAPNEGVIAAYGDFSVADPRGCSLQAPAIPA
jgi:5-methylcytosine-specific restriction endonuclease McrA